LFFSTGFGCIKNLPDVNYLYNFLIKINNGYPNLINLGKDLVLEKNTALDNRSPNGIGD